MGERHLSEVELTEYADGATAPSRVRRVEDHLRVCALCSEALAGVRTATTALRHLPAVAAPDDLRERVADRLTAGHARPLTCREAGPLIHAQVDGELAPAMMAPLRRHLRECLHCHAELVALSAVAGLVRSLRVLATPAAVRETVWAALRVHQEPAQVGRPLSAPWAARLGPALAAAAVVAVGVLGFLGSRARPARPTPAVVATAPMATDAPTAEPRKADTEVAAPGPSDVPGSFELPSPPAEVSPGRKVERATGGAFVQTRKNRVMERMAAEPIRLADASRGGKGPAPEPTRGSLATPGPRLPSAVRTLKEIAMAYGVTSEGQRALSLAGEEFLTLTSESSLSRLPEAGAQPPSVRTPDASPRAGEADRGGLGPQSKPEGNRASAPLPGAPVV